MMTAGLSITDLACKTLTVPNHLLLHSGFMLSMPIIHRIDLLEQGHHFDGPLFFSL